MSSVIITTDFQHKYATGVVMIINIIIYQLMHGEITVCHLLLKTENMQHKLQYYFAFIVKFVDQLLNSRYENSSFT